MHGVGGFVRLEVGDRAAYDNRIVAELTKTRVAGGTEDPSNPPRDMIMVHMLGGVLTTQRAHSPLRLDHALHIGRSESVFSDQVVMTRATV